MQHANDEIAQAVLKNHWLVREMKSCAAHNAWFTATIVVLSILSSGIMTPMMY